MGYWMLKFVLLGPLLRLFLRPRVEGVENVPTTGAAILAANHLAVVDSFVLPLRMPRQVFWAAKAEYFTGSGIKGKITKFFFANTGSVPVDRTGGSAAQAVLNTWKRLLNDGKLLGVHIEGTRSPDGRLYRGKTGVARAAIESGVPVIPVALIDTDKVNPIGSRMWRPHRITIRYGAPLDFSRYDGMSGDRFVERSVTDEIMYQIMLLSGQEYVDVYAASVKRAMDKTGRSADDVVRDLRHDPPSGESVDRVHSNSA